jgi:hypothetical protein
MLARTKGTNSAAFLSPDFGYDLGQGSWNRYAYVAGNPINCGDPSGREAVNCNSAMHWLDPECYGDPRWFGSSNFSDRYFPRSANFTAGSSQAFDDLFGLDIFQIQFGHYSVGVSSCIYDGHGQIVCSQDPPDWGWDVSLDSVSVASNVQASGQAPLPDPADTVMAMDDVATVIDAGSCGVVLAAAGYGALVGNVPGAFMGAGVGEIWVRPAIMTSNIISVQSTALAVMAPGDPLEKNIASTLTVAGLGVQEACLNAVLAATASLNDRHLVAPIVRSWMGGLFSW